MRSAELIDANINVDFIDINMGCPIDLIYNKVIQIISSRTLFHLSHFQTCLLLYSSYVGYGICSVRKTQTYGGDRYKREQSDFRPFDYQS